MTNNSKIIKREKLELLSHLQTQARHFTPTATRKASKPTQPFFLSLEGKQKIVTANDKRVKK